MVCVTTNDPKVLVVMNFEIRNEIVDIFGGNQSGGVTLSQATSTEH